MRGKRILLAVVLCAAPALSDPRTAPGNREPFTPGAGYARTTRLLYLRRAAPPQEDIPEDNVLFGTRAVPVVCLAFKNRLPPHGIVKYQQALFSPPGPVRRDMTMTQYFKDVSHGRLVVTGEVVGWHVLPKDDTHYEGKKNGLEGPGFVEFVLEGLKWADQQLDFARFDNDGPDGIPNSGDDDGNVDTVFFLHPECGGETRHIDDKRNIWSHSYRIDWLTKKPFVTNDIQRDKNGDPVLVGGQPVRIKIIDYTVQPGLSRPADNPNRQELVKIGVFCHEYGHALGLPDLYDRTEKPKDCYGAGNWCLMAGGSWGGDGRSPAVPPHMSAWCKDYLGWAQVERVRETRRVHLEAAADSGKAYRIDVPDTGGKEYFLVEFRDPSWRDTVYEARVNWDRGLPGPGLAVWHIDNRIGDSSSIWPFAKRNEGQNDMPSLAGYSAPPKMAPHALVALEQADRQQDLENRASDGDAGDLWRDADDFHDDPKAGARPYGGGPPVLRISQIRLAARSALIRVSQPAPLVPTEGAPDEGPPPAGIDVARLNEVVAHLRAGKPLGEEQRRWASQLSAREIALFVPPEVRERVRALGKAKLLTGEGLPEWTRPFVKSGSEARYADAFDSVVTLQDVNVEPAAIPKLLARLLADGRLIPGDPSTEGRQTTIELRMRIGSETLPVFDHKIEYIVNDKGALVWLKRSPVAKGLEVRGIDGRVPADRARAIVERRMGVSTKLQSSCVKGVLVSKRQPTLGHVAWRVGLPTGSHSELRVFVGVQEARILDIR